MDYSAYFKDKRITVMGLGLLGRGLGDTAFLAECGAKLIVTDLKSESELAGSLKELEKFSDITYVLGEHRMEDFKERDLILSAANVPLDSPYLEEARRNGIEVTQSAVLFAKLSGIPIIGVTGTRGKSTIAHMIHHVLESATGEKIILGGNIRGISNLQLLKEVHEDSLAVFELDSWQLQAFGWAKISPQIAVFSNFMEDHLNYYHNDMDAYFADKANIFLHQEESGVFITTPEVFERAKKFAEKQSVTLGQEVVLVDESVLPEDTLLATPGEHNRLNAALAYQALKAAGLSEEEIMEGLASFPGVPGRLQYVREVNGVKIYNDNNATTPSATLAGLHALGEKQNIILIMGGADKGIDPGELVDEIKKSTKKVVMLAGTGTDTVKDRIEGEVVESIDDAVAQALKGAEDGDIVLFSPAFASFGMFENEYDRNDQFMGIVEKL